MMVPWTIPMVTNSAFFINLKRLPLIENCFTNSSEAPLLPDIPIVNLQSTITVVIVTSKQLCWNNTHNDKKCL